MLSNAFFLPLLFLPFCGAENSTTTLSSNPCLRDSRGLNDTPWEVSIIMTISTRAGVDNFELLKSTLYKELARCFAIKDDSYIPCLRIWYRPAPAPPLISSVDELEAAMSAIRYSDAAVNATEVDPDSEGRTLDIVWEALIRMNPDFNRRLPFFGLVSDFVSVSFAGDAGNDTLFISIFQKIEYSLDIIGADPTEYYRSLLANQNIHKISSFADFRSYYALCLPPPPDPDATTPTPKPNQSDILTDTTALISLAVVLVCFFAILVIAAVSCCYLRNKWRWKREVLHVLHGNENRAYRAETERGDKWEMRLVDLHVQLDGILGGGAFGSVYKGHLHGLSPLNKIYSNSLEVKHYANCEVAVKMLPKFLESTVGVNEFAKEIDINKSICYHVNLVNMLGCITVGFPKCLVLEFCQYGDLLHYVRRRKDKFVNGTSDNDDTESLTEADLTSFAWQICNGMNYLHEAGVIHRDLAARNVLIAEGKVAKVADFGLSRHNLEGSIYTAVSGRLPVKWLALESLKTYQFNRETDIWSFGVVLWEMFSLGDIPFPLIDPADMIERLEAGMRLRQPVKSSDAMYDIMTCCWRENPVDRPNWVELKTKIAEILVEIRGADNGYLELLPENYG